MRIKQVSIRDFRGIQALDFNPGFLTVVTGQNGAGKTSLGGALGWWASGRSPWTAENGYGLTDLIRRGADTASVTLTFDGPGGEVSATRQAPPHKISLTGSPPDIGVAEAQQRLNEVMGCPGNMARLALEPGRFFALDAKKRNTLMGELLGLFLTPQRVQALLQDREEACGLPLVRTAQELLKGPVSNNFGHAHNAFKAAFTAAGQESKSATERLKAEQERLTALQEAMKGQPPAPTAKDLQAARDEARAVHLMLLKARSWQEGVRVITAERDRARQRVEELQQEVRDVPSVEDARAYCLEEEARLAERQRERAELRKRQHERQDAISRIGGLKAQIGEIEAAITRATCPECKSPLPEAARAALEQRADALLQEALALREMARSPDPADQIADLNERVKRGEVEVARRRHLHQVAEGAELLRSQLARAAQDLQRQERRLATHLEETHSDEETLVEWDARNQEIVREMESHAGAPGQVERCQGQIKAYEQQIAAAEQRRKVLNELKWWFGPEGIQRQHLQERVGPVVDNVNAILGRWGYEVRWDEALDLTVRTPATDGKFIPVANVSDAEWIVVALSHQVWLAAVTGIRILVVDRIEAVDEAGQAALFEALMGLQDQLDHAFILGVATRVPPPAEAVVIDFDKLREA